MREMKRMGRRRRGRERREISSPSPFCTLAQEKRKRGRERESETERNLLLLSSPLLSLTCACACLYERRGDEEREGRRFHRPPYLCTWEGGEEEEWRYGDEVEDDGNSRCMQLERKEERKRKIGRLKELSSIP